MVSSLPTRSGRPAAFRGTPAWWVATALVLGEMVLALAGWASLGIAGAALLAPGLALGGLLPAPMRAHALSRWALAPALGLAATSVALISLAKVGVPLTEVSERAVLVVLVMAGLGVEWVGWRAGGEGSAGGEAGAGGEASAGGEAGRTSNYHPPGGGNSTLTAELGAAGAESGRRGGLLLEGGILAGLVVLAAVLAWNVIGTLPIPGNDWAKYLLYADEISRHHKLLIDNPFWLGGVPFREDPGMPALMGPALIMSGATAGALAQAIIVLALALVLAVYGGTRPFLGPVGALAATTFMVVVPASQNILGWHGLANLGALAILALVLAQAGAWLRGELDGDLRAEIGFGLTLVGVAAAHRLTTAIMIAVLGVALLARLVWPAVRTRRDVLLSVLRIVGAAVVLGLLVALDLRARSATSGGTLPYTSYLGTKLDLELAVRDITIPMLVIAVLSGIGLSLRGRLDRALWPPLALGAVCVALAYVWLLHLPLYYARMVFYLPLALAPVAGAGVAAVAAWLLERRRAGAKSSRFALPGFGLVAAALVAVLAVGAWNQGDAVRRYYLFANPASLKGLDALTQTLRPGEPVTTDRCWSFLSAWLLRTESYPALADQDIGPRAELPIARKGRAMMRGTREGRKLARELGVRFALVDPTCPATRETVRPPGDVVFISQRLAVIRLYR